MTPTMAALLSTQKSALAAALDRTIGQSMLLAYAIASRSGMQPAEPDFVAMMICDAVPRFGALLGHLFTAAGVKAQTTSVFCHGRPEVSQGASKPCELGDVLFVHIHTGPDGSSYRNSILLQAKMSSSLIHAIGAAELHQLRLYTTWGSFTYTRTFGLSGQTRIVSPASSHGGAQYLLIDSRPPTDPLSGLLGAPNTFPMGCCHSQKLLQLYQSLGTVLMDLMCGNNGRPFNDQPSSTSDWSQVVWDLLRHGALKAFNQRRVGIRGLPRRVDSILSFCLERSIAVVGSEPQDGSVARALGMFGDFDGPPPEALTDVKADEEGGGVSIVLIETSETRQG